jgi:long-chain acyl-CoA synthetase
MRAANISLADRIRDMVSLDPSAEALQFGGRWRTWAYLASAIDIIDACLTENGIGQDSAIGVVMRNRPEVVRGIVALLATRRCVVTLSSVIPTADLADEITRMSLPAVLMSECDWAEDQLPAAIRAGGSLGISLLDRDDRAIGDEVKPERPGAQLDAAGVAVQMLTSGTTGTPKRVDLRYRSLEYEIESTASYSPSENLSQVRLRSGTSIIWAPLLHIGGMRALITTLVAGRRIALMERFNVEEWRRLVVEHRPRVVSLAPTALRMVLDAEIPRGTFESVRAVFAGTAPLSPETADEFYERFGVPVLVVYGATEFAGGVAGWTLRDWERYGASKRGSVGRANAGVTLRIVDPETYSPLPPGRSGIVEVMGPQLGSDGWVRTTDLGRMDEDGFLWILGRADDVIIRGGFKVSTSVVREALARHPAVADAAVIGVAHKRLGSAPVAAVELVPGLEGPPTPEDLKHFLREVLTPYQVPVEIRIMDVLPRTPSMKVSQPELRRVFSAIP